jgi:NAD(P)-dependent dehydrogenase (short-subunit alcohol dehydrogenase family)
VECDVGAEDAENQVVQALGQTREQVGTPTVLVAAAGVPGPTAPFPEQPVDGWDRTMAVNVRGVFLCMRDVARAMINDGLDGAIVAISSTSGLYCIPTATAYSTSKATVSQLCRIAALDLGPFGIRVNAVCPGPTATPMLGYLTDDPAYVREVASVTPLGRLGTPELLADAIANILRSDWITGQVIAVDGGESLVTARGRWSLAAGRFGANPGHRADSP